MSNVSVAESTIDGKVSVYLTYLDNKKEFVIATDKINSVKRALKKKDSEEQQRSLFRLIRKDLKAPVMDWIYNATNEETPFYWTSEPIKNKQKTQIC